MSLHYPVLDETSTVKVFRLNLGLIKKRLQERVAIEEDEILVAAAKHWREHEEARLNGRQIRNACQTALALAEFDAQPKGKKYDIREKSTTKVYMKLAHLEVVSNAYLEFTEYLKSVYGADAELRAKESGLRALRFSDKKETKDRDRRRSASREHRQTGSETPLQSFRLRPGSSGHHSPPVATAASSYLDPSQSSAGHPGWISLQQPPHEPPPVQSQRPPYGQGTYGANPSYRGDPQGGGGLVPSSQQELFAGSYHQAPQGYGGGVHGGFVHQRDSAQHYQRQGSPMPLQLQAQQSRGASHSAPAPSSEGGYGPSGGGASPAHYGGGDQSGQSG